MADGFAPVPSWRLFKEFCSLRVQKHLPKSLARVVKDTVLELQPIVGQGTGFPDNACIYKIQQIESK